MARSGFIKGGTAARLTLCDLGTMMRAFLVTKLGRLVS